LLFVVGLLVEPLQQLKERRIGFGRVETRLAVGGRLAHVDAELLDKHAHRRQMPILAAPAGAMQRREAVGMPLVGVEARRAQQPSDLCSALKCCAMKRCISR
jgi:hypothetical protein